GRYTRRFGVARRRRELAQSTPYVTLVVEGSSDNCAHRTLADEVIPDQKGTVSCSCNIESGSFVPAAIDLRTPCHFVSLYACHTVTISTGVCIGHDGQHCIVSQRHDAWWGSVPMHDAQGGTAR